MAIRHDCIPDDVFIKAWEDCNFSPATVAKALGVSERNVYARRNALIAKSGNLYGSPGNHDYLAGGSNAAPVP